jgi:dephospho-CoA kinase
MHVNADPGQALNLHLRVMDSAGWRWALLVRDWLTADASAAAEYLAMKRALAARYGADPTAARYADAKEEWLVGAYSRGLAWADRTGWSPSPG